MTTEDDFQRALDAQPHDWQTRLVFADWLQERGDKRAEGYRALGINRFYPLRVSASRWAWKEPPTEGATHARLPGDWSARLHNRNVYTDEWNTRREADNAAAQTFTTLPPGRRAELLAGM